MGGRSTLYCQGEELVLLVNTASLIFEEFKDLLTAAERFFEDASKHGRIHDAYAMVTKEQKVMTPPGDNDAYARSDNLHQHRHCGIDTNVDLKNLLGQWFPAQSVRSMNEYASNSSYSPFLITRTSQRRQHDKSESVSYYLAD
ncbi:hypothetical protein Tco_0398179 [Tanacetum coccineum]